MITGFTKGLFVGSIIGSSIGMVINNDMIGHKKRHHMMKSGRQLLRRTGFLINDVVSLFR